MGAFHEGHVSLIERSKRENDRTVVSIFVNPTQFGPNEDFKKYPRTIELDYVLASAAGADIVFAPETNEMYGESSTVIHVPSVTELYEGAIRPGHFDGVATIVTKLFNIVSPKNVYFGEKDLQQCAVIRKLIADLKFDINMTVCDTCRESSGLAKSSRNIYLSESEFLIAPTLYLVLTEARNDILKGKNVPEILLKCIKKLQEQSFLVDYLDLVDRRLMRPINAPNEYASVIVAAKLGATRLIDNIKLIG
jgi:pantoate--beta-alanine ligase